MTIRILIADDHNIVRQGLRRVFALAADIEVVAEARDSREVIELLRGRQFDLLLLDLNMPGLSGIDLIRRLRKEAPKLPILILSMHGESQIAGRAVRAGANGYLTKDSEPDTLLAAVREVAAGGNFIDPAIATQLVFSPLPAESPEATPHNLLSNREYEVFLRLAEGQSINDIAECFNLSPKTVSTHKARLMQKLGLASTSDLVRCALRHNLLDG